MFKTDGLFEAVAKSDAKVYKKQDWSSTSSSGYSGTGGSNTICFQLSFQRIWFKVLPGMEGKVTLGCEDHFSFSNSENLKHEQPRINRMTQRIIKHFRLSRTDK